MKEFKIRNIAFTLANEIVIVTDSDTIIFDEEDSKKIFNAVRSLE